MTNSEAKILASEIIGDGKSPNKFFVTACPWYLEIDEYGDHESALLDGFQEDDSETKVFDTLEEAEEYYDQLELDIYDGVGQVLIEDRKTGVIKEKTLEKIIKVDYTMVEFDDTKRFGYKQ